MNKYEDFVIRNIDKPWTWGKYGLSCNPQISAELALLVRKRWEWGEMGMSQNASVMPDFIRARPDISWCWGAKGISANPSITPDFIFENQSQPFEWGHAGLSSNPTIDSRLIDEYSDRPWFWGAGGLSSNPSISELVVDKYSDRFNYGEHGLSSNHSISIEYMMQKAGMWKWGKNGASLKILTCEIDENVPLYWGAFGISSNVNLEEDFIYENRQKLDFGKHGLSSNPCINPWIVRDLEEDWCYEELLRNPSVCQRLNPRLCSTGEIKSWEIHEMSKNTSLSIEAIEENPHLYWCWDFRGLSRNIMVCEKVCESLEIVRSAMSGRPTFESGVMDIIKRYAL